jgi:tetratricopeptide (TPR) repeat protein
VVDYRPDYQATWMSRSYFRQLALSPLGAEASERLLAELLGDDPSLDGLVELIGERSEGNPFFIEEIVQSLVEQGSLAGSRRAYRLVSPIEEVAVPASVQAVLAARIDRLGEREKAVLGAAAVIGREFSQPILEQVAGRAPLELEEALGELVSAEFAYLQEASPQPLYAFKHALTQQVSYGSQLEERRRTLHAKAAEAIVADNPERLEERAALVAAHWETAGEQLEAARWHARAAAWAGTGDPAAALAHWQRVRELADQLPESEESAGLGFAARAALLMFGWRLGISREEAEQLFEEAERMSTLTGDVRSRALLLTNYGALKAVSDGALGEGVRLVRKGVALAEGAEDRPLYVVLANYPTYAFWLIGEAQESLAVADRAIELTGGDPGFGAGLVRICPLAYCFGIKGMILTFLGELEKGDRAIARSREIARAQGDAEVVGWTHFWSGFQGYLMGEPGATLAHARRAVEIAERISDSFTRSWAWFVLGMAEVMRKHWPAALEALARSQEICREQRTAVEGEPQRRAFLAEAHLGLGDNEQAREAATEGVAIARSQGNVPAEAQANLAQARVLLGIDGPDARTQVKAALARTRELIRRTVMKAYEPQVHVELAELARRSGDEEGRVRELREAHRLFTEIGASGYAERVAGELAVATS